MSRAPTTERRTKLDPPDSHHTGNGPFDQSVMDSITEDLSRSEGSKSIPWQSVAGDASNPKERIDGQGETADVVDLVERQRNLCFKDQSQQFHRGTDPNSITEERDSTTEDELFTPKGSNSGTQEIIHDPVNIVAAELIPPSQLDMSPLYGADANPIPTGTVFSKPVVEKKRRCCLVVSSIVIAIAILSGAIGGGIVASRASPKGSLSPTTAPIAVRSVIAGVSENGSLPRPDTPQGQALEWLENSATETLPEDSSRLLIRYALATLFFAMNGDNWSTRANFVSNDHECDWSFGGTFGVVYNSARQVATLSLPNNSVRNQIPNEIGLLSDLSILNLQGDVVRGATVNVKTNAITGTLPTMLGMLTNLIQINLSQNGDIEGTIPTELANLDRLVELRLNDNSISGSIPASIGRLSSLTFIDLEGNQLTGSAVPLSNIRCALLGENNLSACFGRRRMQAFFVDTPEDCAKYTPPCELPR